MQEGQPDSGELPPDAAPGKRRVTVRLGGRPGGSVAGTGVTCGSTCTVELTDGDPLSLTATPPGGMLFLGWGGAPGCYRDAVCNTTVSRDLDVTAVFGLDGDAGWMVQLGAMSFDSVGSLVVNADGDLYVSGYWTTGGITIGTKTFNAVGTDAYLAKISGGDGRILWAKRLGGDGDDGVSSLAADPATGDVIVAGRFTSPADLGGAAALTSLDGDGSDLFLARYASLDGAQVWQQAIKTTGSAGIELETTSDGDLILGVGFDNTIDLGDGAVSTFGGNDLAFARLDGGDRHVEWKKHWGSAGSEMLAELRLDAVGNITVAGNFDGSFRLSDVGSDPLLVSAGNIDIFVAKLGSVNGNYIWSLRFGGTVEERVRGLAVNPLDNSVAVLGFMNSGASLTGVTIPDATVSVPEIFVVKFTSAGVQSWGRRFATASIVEEGIDAVFDSRGELVITGIYTADISFDGNAILKRSAHDIFLVYVNAATGSATWAVGYGGTDHDDPAAIVADTHGRVFLGGSFGNQGFFTPREATSIQYSDGFVVGVIRTLP